MTIREVNFAVVGCGLMGQRHAEVIRATPGARLVALCDRNPDVAAKTARGEETTAEYHELINRNDVDAVVLCLPSNLHAEYGILAAERGKHVVAEKPLDSDPAAAKTLAATCTTAGVLCAEIKQNRFSEGLATLKLAVDSGLLGKIVLARASVKWFRHDPYYAESNWRGRLAGEGGGVLINQAIHAIDLLLWLFGPPASVSAMLERNRREVMETEDTAIALFRFAGGILASLEATTSGYPGFDERYEVQGLKGSCHIEKGKIVLWEQEDGVPPPAPPAFEAPSPGLEPRLLLFQRQYRNILAAIRGDAPLLVQPGEAVAVVETTRSLYSHPR